MRMSKESKTEDLRLQQFVLEKNGVMLNEITIQVPISTSTFAIAAMLKGLQEYYYKPAGLEHNDPEAVKATEHNLKIWHDTNNKSRLIIP